MKKLIIITLAFCLLFALSATALAATDTAGHWAESELNEWESESLITGDGAGELRPNDAITRAEFMAIVNRWRGYQGTSDKISQFTDVAQGAWYYNEISAALAAGYITGNPDMTMNPNAPITREEAMAIVARINAMTDAEDKTVLSKASDGSDVAAWAQGLVAAVVNEGLISGSEGKLTPKANITRAEAVTLFDRVRDNVRIYTFEGTYGPATGKQAVSKVIVAGSGVVLRNLNVSGELTVNVPNAEVTLTDSTVATVTIPNTNTTLNTTGATTLNAVNANAAGAKIATSAGTSIGTLTMNAATTVSGTGNVSVANVKSEGVVMEKAPGISNIDSGLTADIGTGSSTGGTTGGDPSAPGTGGSVTDPTPPPTPSIGITSVTLTNANTIEIKLNSNIDVTTENATDYIKVTLNNTSTVLAESHSYNANTFTYTVTFDATLVNKNVLNIAMAKKGYTSVNRTLTVDFTPFVLGEISAAMDADTDNNPYFDDLYANYDRKVAITSGTFTVKKGAETIWSEDVAAMGNNSAAWFSYGLRNLGATTGAGAAKIATGADAGKPLFPDLEDADISTVTEPARGEIERTNTYLLKAGDIINISISVIVGAGDYASASAYTVSKDYTVTANDVARASMKTADEIAAAKTKFLDDHEIILAKTAEDITNATLEADKPLVTAARAALNLLGVTVRQDSAVQSAETLIIAMETKIADLQATADAAAFESAHSAALALTTTNVAVANKAAVIAAKNAYTALSAAAKAKVTDSANIITKLDALLARIAVLEAAAKFKADHATALAIVLDQDSTKWSFTNAQISAINAVKAAYDALTSTVQNELTEQKTKLDSLVTALKVFQDKNAANAFKLNNKDALALAVKASYTTAEIELVTNARKAYNALTAEAKALLTAENTTLANLETAIKPSQDANAFKEAHKAALALVVKASYTADEIGLINAAVDAYTALTAEAKALLTAEKAHLDSLVAAITSSDAGDAAAAFKTTHATALALTVTNVATTNETIVDAAVTAYNDLTAEAKALLGTQKTLLNSLVARIDVLKAAETAAAAFKTTHEDALALTGSETAYTAEQIGLVTAAIDAFKEITDTDVKALLTAGNTKLVDTVTPHIGTVIDSDITALKADATANDTELQFPLGIAAADFNARVEAALAVETLQTAAGKVNLISADNVTLRGKAKTAADRAMALDGAKDDLFWTTAEDVVFTTDSTGKYVDTDGTALTDLALDVTVAVAFNENKEFYTFIQLGTETETVRSLNLSTVDYYTGKNGTVGDLDSGTLEADDVIMVVSRIPLAADRTPGMKRDDTGQGGVTGMTAMEKPEAGEGGLLENFPTSGAGNADNLMQDFLRITATDGPTGAMRFGFNYGPSVADGPDLIEYFWLFIHVGAND